MYEVLTKLKLLETTSIGQDLGVGVKFRNDRDGLIDIHIKDLPTAVMHAEHSGNAYRVVAGDTSWVRCQNVDEIYTWTFHKLHEIKALRDKR